MYATTTKTSKPLVITGRDILASPRKAFQLSFRCETHGKKGRKSRADVSRRAISEQC